MKKLSQIGSYMGCETIWLFVKYNIFRELCCTVLERPICWNARKYLYLQNIGCGSAESNLKTSFSFSFASALTFPYICFANPYQL